MLAALLRAVLVTTLLPIAAAVAGPALAEPVVTSAAPQRVALTVYRAAYGRGAIDLRWLGGFAQVTETRRIALPRGRATLRFEGVADGIVPASAVIDGLPGGVVEKSRDLRLLSPAALVDGTLGRQVTLTRTDAPPAAPAAKARRSSPARTPAWCCVPPRGSRRCAVPACPNGCRSPARPPACPANRC
jgi:hypothetical protein